MTDKSEQCSHKRLGFASGGFYVQCADCNAMWVAKKSGRPDLEIDYDRPSGLSMHDLRIAALSKHPTPRPDYEDGYLAGELAASFPAPTDTGMVELIERDWALAAFDQANNVFASYMGDPDGNDDTETARDEAAKVIARAAADALSSLQAEKAQIVGWLRNEIGPAGFTCESPAQLADAIERGDHLQPKVAHPEGER